MPITMEVLSVTCYNTQQCYQDTVAWLLLTTSMEELE